MRPAAVIFAIVTCLLVLTPGRGIGQVLACGHVCAEVVDVMITSAESQVSPINLTADNSNIPMGTQSNSDHNICPATLSICGIKDATFAVTLPMGTTTLSKTDGSDTIRISDWKATSGCLCDGAYRLTGGLQDIIVGATVKSDSHKEQSTGTYTGSFEITLAYN